MVAVVVSAGLGLERSSAWVLGSRGQIGQAAFGQAQENVYLNAATGNLVIQNRDQMLIGRGPDNVVSRTYNSLGQLDDDNNDGWRMSVYRKAIFSGSVGLPGSKVTRTDWDGSETVYTWDGSRNAYIDQAGVYSTNQGAGAFDQFTVSGNILSWRDGDSQVTETYNKTTGQLISLSDLDGNTLSYTYDPTSGLITEIATADGGLTRFSYYAGTRNLQQITTLRLVGAVESEVVTRISYTYDSLNRLSTVQVELTPENPDVAIYKTTYTYDGTSTRVASITQDDGSVLEVGYSLIDADYRVTSLKQLVSGTIGVDSVSRETRISYDTVNRKTFVTDPAGQVTELWYDARGQLTRTFLPAATPDGATQQTSFSYGGTTGDVLTITGPNGVYTYTYDDRGNRISEQDSAGNRIERTYGPRNELLTEVVYLAPVSGSPPAAGAPQTTRYVYDANNHLRYVVSAEGNVSEYRYNLSGQRISATQYTGDLDRYNKASFTLSDFDNWRMEASRSPISSRTHVDYEYDFRGNLLTTTTFEKTVVAKASNPAPGHENDPDPLQREIGDETGQVSRTHYVYDQAGQLLSRITRLTSSTDTNGLQEVFTYDSLGRLLTSTSPTGLKTSFTFSDSTQTAIVETRNGPAMAGAVRALVYDKMGELLSVTEKDGATVLAQTSYRYDVRGQVRATIVATSATDLTGATAVKSYALYDDRGRKTADISTTGTVTAYAYDVRDRLVSTVRYATPLSAAQLSSLLVGGEPASLVVDGKVRYLGLDPIKDAANTVLAPGLRPAAHTDDRWNWYVYDVANRLVQTIDGAGAVINYAYDGASRLVSTTALANVMSTTLVNGYKISPPTTPRVPTATTATEADRVIRNFYDGDGRLIGKLDGEGYLSEIRYDRAGRQVQTIGYVTRTVEADRAAGTFDALKAGVDQPNAPNIRTHVLYDGRGLVRATIDGEGLVTRYDYTPLGQVSSQTRGQKLDPASLVVPPPTFATLPAPTEAILETVNHSYDVFGLLIGDSQLLSDGRTQTTTYVYDGMKRLVRTTTQVITATDTRAPAPLTPPPGYTSTAPSAGNDALTGGDGNDVINAGGGNDWLNGGAGNDTLIGNTGDDILIGGAGNDILNGNAGADVFVITRGGGADTIKDFTPPLDKIDISALGRWTSRVQAGLDTLITFADGTTVRLQGITETTLQDSDFIFGPSDARSADRRYDLQGRLTGELSGEGGAALAALGAGATAGQIDAIYRTYGTTYSYDAASRLVSRTDADGVDGPGNRTVYYYDDAGRLTYAINAYGEVVEHRYNAFGDQSDVIGYGRRIGPDKLGALTGGRADGALATALTGLTNTAVDSKTSYSYNVTGALQSVLTQLDTVDKSSTTYSYNAFGELSSSTKLLNATDSQVVARVYDRRGLLIGQTTDSAGLQLATGFTYDAFGRVFTATDLNGGVRTTTYDRAGRLLSIKDAANGVQTFTYDARGNLLTSIDRTGKVTGYSYDKFNRTVIVTTPEGLVTTKTTNIHGDTISVTDPEGRTISYSYDLDGQIKTVTDAAGVVQASNTYDLAGKLKEVVDARGVKTSYSYDVVDRVLTRTVDGGGLALTTTYEYDAKGQQVRVTAGGVVTKIDYDLAGRRVQISIDPDGLNLKTAYVYDKGGRQVKVTEGAETAAARVTKYEYDKADRLIRATVDPDGLGLATNYLYDKAGNVVSRKDAADGITRFVYDAENRQIFSVDPTGAVARTDYDAEGRVVAQVAFANRNTVPTGTILTAITAAVTGDAADQTTRLVYDGDGRLRFSIDSLGYVGERVYDGSGNVTRTVRYAAAIAPSTWTYAAVRAAVDIQPAGSAHVSRAAYDAAGRQLFSVDAAGMVTRFAYDAAGNAIKQIRYATAYSGSGDLTAAGMQAWAALPANNTTADRLSRVLYDNAGRAIYAVDALGQVTETQYRADGQVARRIAYSGTYTVTDATTRTQLGGALAAAGVTTVATSYGYDAAGRLTDITDAENGVIHRVLDARGQVIDSISAYGTAQASTTRRTYDAAGRVLTETRAFGEGEATRTRYAYDGVGRVTDRTVADGTADASTTHWTYDAAGQIKTETRASNDSSISSTTSYDYDAFGRVVTITDGMGSATTRTYDKMDRVLTVTVPLATGVTAVTTNRYDGFGNLATVTDPRGNTGFFFYDALDRLTQQVDPEGYLTRTEYSAFGDKVAVTRFASGASSQTAQIWRLFDIAYGRMPTALETTQWLAALKAKPSQAVPSGWPTLDGHLDVNGVDVSVLLAFAADFLAIPAVSAALEGGAPKANATFVENLYQRALGRSPDAGELATWTTRLSTGGWSRGAALAYVSESASHRDGMPAKLLAVVTGDADAITRFQYDKLGRVTQVTDAEGKFETYVLDAFGNRTSVTNKVGGVTSYTYDKRGLMLSETLPVTSLNRSGDATSVVNRFEYDVRGNRTKLTEAAGLPEERATSYSFDKLDRLILTSYASVQTVSPDLQTVKTEDPTETVRYNARGDIVETVDKGGAHRLFYYDALGRKVAELDALGTLSAWTYDKNNNAKTMKVYGAAVTAPVDGSRPQAPTTGGLRTTSYDYDKNNRLTKTTVSGVTVGAYVGTSYTSSANANIVTETVYDASGNVIQQIDALNNSTFSFYDRLGRRIARVDQENYLTSYTVDAEGNVTLEERFANRLGAPVTTASDPAGLRNGVAKDAAADRVTKFSYDRNGRRLTEERLKVAYGTVNATTAAYADANGAALIRYEYDGLGNVTRKTEATGDYVSYAYDALGRQTSSTTSAFETYLGVNPSLPISSSNAAQTTVRKTTNVYDGLNNLLSTRVGGVTASGADRVTLYSYERGSGRLASVTDAAGFKRDYGYDLAGHVVKESYDRLKSGSVFVTEANAYRYDALGRATFQATAALSGSTWTFGDQTHLRYNSYGEVTGKGITKGGTANAVFQETFDYDNAGRLWRSTSGDGVTKLFVQDKAGATTLTITSNGVKNLADYASLTDALADLIPSGTIGTAAPANGLLSVSVFDRRGQNTQTQELFRQLADGAPLASINKSKTYNAFGEVAAETDARGYTTDYRYNTAGKLIEKKSPQVSATSEAGVPSPVRPTEAYAYDLSGRLISVLDANGQRNSRQLLAGTGYGGSEALVVKVQNADNTVTRTGYDIFGDARTLTNGLGAIEGRTYDGMGRLLTLTRASRDGGVTPGLVEVFTYDGLGQRLTHGNNLLRSARERTEYDLQGRVVSFIDYENHPTTYSYVFDNSLVTRGAETATPGVYATFGAFGGWIKTTVNVSGKTEVEKQDYFGRQVDRTNYGGQASINSYDTAGRLVRTQGAFQGNLIARKDVTYQYYNTGKISAILDKSTSPMTTPVQHPVGGHPSENPEVPQQMFWEWDIEATSSAFAYDLSGNRIKEDYTTARTHYTWDMEIVSAGLPVTVQAQKATVSYDALNRMTQFYDAGGERFVNELVGKAVTQAVTVNYKYDAVGNVRNVNTSYTAIGSSTPAAPQDYWYRYDSMNRFTTTRGQLVGGVWSRGANGVDINYDEAGQRKVATTGEGATATRETYSYTADGYLSGVDIKTGVGFTTNAGNVIQGRDAMGRLSGYTEQRWVAAVGAAPGYYQTVYSRSGISYDANSLITQEVTSSLQSSGAVNTGTVYYAYVDQGSPTTYIGQVTKTYTTGLPTNTETVTSYDWGDTALQKLVSYRPNTSGSTTYTSLYTYDAGGRVLSVKIADGQPRTVYYATDSQGQVLTRFDNRSGVKPLTYYYYFNGLRVGEITNEGAGETSYAAAINSRVATPPSSFTAQPYADFDQSYSAVTPGSSSGGASQYTVQDGDTLQSIASAVWGDAALWYVLADANGLSGSESLAGGTTLIVPNKVVNVHNNADTFRPYDPNKAIGDVSPTQAPPPPKGAGCGTVGTIIMVIVAIVVTIYTAGAASTAIYAALGTTAATASAATVIAVGAASAAIGGAVGSIASQGVGIAIGAQDKFSWNAVGISALSAVVTQGLGGWSPTGGVVTDAIIRGAAASAITQGVAVATGMQSKFDWTGVAVAGVSAGVGAWTGGELGQYAANKDIGWLQNGTMGNDLAASFAGGTAGAAGRSLIDGSNFGDNLKRAIPDIIGQTIGNKIGEKVRVAMELRTPQDDAAPAGSDGSYLTESLMRSAEQMAQSEGSASSMFRRSLADIMSQPDNLPVEQAAEARANTSAVTAKEAKLPSSDATEMDEVIVTASKGPRRHIANGTYWSPNSGAWRGKPDIVGRIDGQYILSFNIPYQHTTPTGEYNVTSPYGKVTIASPTADIQVSIEGMDENSPTISFFNGDTDKWSDDFSYTEGSVIKPFENTAVRIQTQTDSFKEHRDQLLRENQWMVWVALAPDMALGIVELPAVARGIVGLGKWVATNFGPTGARLANFGREFLADTSGSVPLLGRGGANGATESIATAPLNTRIALQGVTDRAVADLAANPALARRLMSPGSYQHLVEGTNLASASYGKAVERLTAEYVSVDPALSNILSYQSRPFVSTPDFLGYEGYNLRALDITTEASRASHLARPYGAYTEIVTHPGLPSNLVFPR